MKKICALVAILWIGLILCPSLGLAQSEKEGIALFNEANELRTKAHSKEDREKALQKYQEALEIFRKVRSEKRQATTLTSMGAVYASRSQYQQALEYYDKALDLHQKVGNVKGQAATLANTGTVYRNLGQFQKALEHQESALALHRKISNLQGEGRALSALSYTYRGIGQYHKAMECAEKYLAISKQIKNINDEGNALVEIGQVSQLMGEYQKARENFEKGLEIQKKTGNLQAEGSALGGLGEVYRHLGQYKKALDYEERSLEIYRKIGNARQEGAALNNMALVYTARGQYQKSLENYEKSLEIWRKIGEVNSEATTLDNVGRIYVNWGQHQKALEYCNKALAIQRRIGARQGEAWSCGLMGSIYHAWGQRQKALENYEKACELTRTIGDQNGEANNYSNIGRVCFGSAKYDDALKNYQRALEIKNKIGAPTHSIKALIAWTYMEQGDLDKAAEVLKEKNSHSWALGKMHLLKSEYDEAKTNYEKLATSAEKSGNVDALFTAYTGLGKVYEGLEDYKKAEQYYAKGMKLTEEIRSGLLPSERTSFFEVKIYGFPRSEPAKGLTRVRMKMNQAAGSIDSSEVTRARAFSDSMSQRTEVGYSGVAKDVLVKEDELVTRVAALKKDRNKSDKDKDPARYENISKEIQKSEAELNKFVEMLWDKHKAYASVKYPRPVTLKEASVRPEEHVVIFDVVVEGVGVKLIKGKEIVQTFYTKWNSDDLEKDIKSFRAPFEQAKLREFDPELGKMLYKKLLGAVMMHVSEGTPIVIIPDGILAVLPFEALVVSGKATWKKGEIGDYPKGLTYLGDLYPVSYCQSITALTLARTIGEKKRSGDRLLVIADPIFELQDIRVQAAKQTQLAAKEEEYYLNLMTTIEESSEGTFKFARLAETEALAKDLGNIYRGKSEVLTGMQANKSHFMSDLAPKLDQYRWIVFATHGLFSNKIPVITEPFLALTMVPPGTDGFLRMTEVMGLKMNADVVALTACQTGLGKELSGEGVMSMGRAFQYAGAKSVLMSLWSVAEKSSVQLVESFFKHIKEGKSKLESLKLARQEVRKDGYDHPFFWASFILVGETAPR
jgi:tetratricopeptide (TPR) repeat protein